MSLGEHVRKNWVEYLLLGLGTYFLSRNKKAKKLIGVVVKKARNNVKKLLDIEAKKVGK